MDGGLFVVFISVALLASNLLFETISAKNIVLTPIFAGRASSCSDVLRVGQWVFKSTGVTSLGGNCFKVTECFPFLMELEWKS